MKLNTLVCVLTFCTLSGCQGNPPLKVTRSQQAALDEVVIEVTREARIRRGQNAFVDKETISRLLHERDVRVRRILTEDQWHHYDTIERPGLESRIYRVSVRRDEPDLRPNTYIRVAPRSQGML